MSDELRDKVARTIHDVMAAGGDCFAQADAVLAIREIREADWDEARRYSAALERARDEERENARAARRERDEARAALAAAQEEVNHWRVKAECYGGMVHGCAPALAAAGFPVDASGPDGGVGGVRRSVEGLAAALAAAQARTLLASPAPVEPEGCGCTGDGHKTDCAFWQSLASPAPERCNYCGGAHDVRDCAKCNDLITRHAAPSPAVPPEYERAVEALREIDRFRPDMSSVETARKSIGLEMAKCPECAEWRLRRHPVQTMCDGHYRALSRNTRDREHVYNTQGMRMKEIARAALAAVDAARGQR